MNWPGTRILMRQPTPRLLRRLCVAVLVAVVVATAGCLGTFLGARHAVLAVDHRVLPAATSLAKIWTDLYEVDSSLANCAPEGGAGSEQSDCLVVLAAGEYHSRIADVVQQVAVLAERGVGTSADLQTLQVVQGLLIRYLGLVEQAHYYLGQDRTLLAEAYLRYASDLLLGSIRSELDTYRLTVGQTLSEQRGSPWGTTWTILIWLLPLLIALVLLLVTQVYLVRRFNRWLNWPLVAASLALVLLGIAAAQPRWTDPGFDQASARLNRLVSTPLPENTGMIGPGTHLMNQIDNAARSYQLEYLMIGLAGAILVLIVAGFQQRLDEYRMRSR